MNPPAKIAHHRLHYTAPPPSWKEGLPIGNGRLAAMVLGTFKRDRLPLNHEWLWRGVNRGRENREVAHLLPEVRELLLAGAYEEGTRKANQAFGNHTGARPKRMPRNRVDPYQPAGDLVIHLSHGFVTEYERSLDLTSGIATARYQVPGGMIERTYLVHADRDVILVRYTATGTTLSGRIGLERIPDSACHIETHARIEASDDPSTPETAELTLLGAFEAGTAFVVRAACAIGGGVLLSAPTPNDSGQVEFRDTETVTIAIDIGTDAVFDDPLRELAGKQDVAIQELASSWDSIVDEQKASFGEAMRGFEVELELTEAAQKRDTIPTDRRIASVRAGEEDPGLILTYCNYARYLLCASSIKGSLPANLQGKWNEDLDPPWNSDYHHDINLQMTYWIAEPTGLAGCTDALFDHIERFVPHGKQAAMSLYGCRGVWLPIQTDAWGRATPESYGWAVWIGAAPWLAQHLWWRWEYGRNREELEARVYPFLKLVARFYEDYLIADESGMLQIVPSQSPENRFVDSGPDHPVSICVSATMDLQLAWDLLTHTVAAAKILGVDEEDAAIWRSMLSRLPEHRIGSDGRLLEWSDELEEAEPGHRHLSHLFGLYPGEQIDPRRTPELYEAARASLDFRLSHEGGHTGWSRAWTACCFARLGDGNAALSHLEHLITDFATDSLLDLHPPGIFQIEGNLGGAAALVEMLFTSYREELDFLPALPDRFSTGRVRGLKARGGYAVDLAWRDGELDFARIEAIEDRICTVHSRYSAYRVTDESGSHVPVESSDGVVRFPVRSGVAYRISPG